MSRVSRETLDKLQAFFDTLEPEVQSKCALCNETLVHIVKLAEVQTGAGTATVTRELAARVNDVAASGDIVSGEELRGRVRQKETDRNLSGHNDQIKTTQPQQDQPEIKPTPKQEPKQESKQESKQETKHKPKQEQPDRRVTDNFINAYNDLKYAIQGEKMAGWSDMTKDTATKHMGYLIDLINIGR